MRIRTRETVERIARALNAGESFSLIRLADGEMRAVQSMTRGLMPDGYSKSWGRPAPELAAAHLEPCLAGLEKADMLGLPFSVGTSFYGALMEAFKPLVNMDERVLCDSCIHAYMVIGGQLWELLKGQRILIMNDQPQAIVDAVATGSYSEQFRHYGIGSHPPWDIVATVRTDSQIEPGDEQYQSKESPPSWTPIERYVEQAAGHDFDIALVGFGWRAMAVCPLLAESTGKVVLDMGHVLRELWLDRPHWRAGSSWGGLQEHAAEELG